ncbi:MAG TPA: hemolysin III family protein [Deltaproteobacteria bacterium]|nr:hemolysin III family protein [Deltaproteobacteria bacterium]HQI81728.1 hemolysin III family protein [Deltaproteobacteria bacterium]
MARSLRDPVSGLTHFIGALLAVAGLAALIVKASNPLRPWHLTTYCVFGAGMILLYTASTLYHWLPLGSTGRSRLRKLDHMMIFVLIAATYTPFCLVPLRGAWGWSIFGTVWAVALMGIVFKAFWIHAPRWLSAAMYVCMGWIVIVGIVPLVRTLQPGGLFWLVTGGLLYTAGGLIYAVKRPDPFPEVFGFHEIFHIFVMLGTLAHFWTIYKYVSAFS